MSLPAARERLAHEISAKGREHAERAERNHQLSTIVRLDPLTVVLFESKRQLVVPDTLTLGQWVSQYDHNSGLELNDNLVLHQTSGHWVAVEVLADKPPMSATTGPAGPPGATGPAGPAGTPYIHDQTALGAATTWTINHHLGYYPNVECTDTTGREVTPVVVHVSTSQAVAHWGTDLMNGYATCI